MLIARAKGVASSLADIMRPRAASMNFPSRAMSLISSIQSANEGVGQSFLPDLAGRQVASPEHVHQDELSTDQSHCHFCGWSETFGSPARGTRRNPTSLVVVARTVAAIAVAH